MHPKLQQVANGILKFRDCSCTEGHRGEELQNFYFDTGRSKTRFPDSKHNANPSRAMDLLPYPFKSEWWNVKDYFHIWAEWGSWVCGFAAGMGIKLRWGFDWDQDFDLKDQNFYDGPHFELDVNEL